MVSWPDLTFLACILPLKEIRTRASNEPNERIRRLNEAAEDRRLRNSIEKFHWLNANHVDGFG